jgi:predicted Fe-Mo cluster-binding NifX family protein
MKICFPILADKGLESPVNNHFGSTRKFLIYDLDSGSFETVENSDAGHVHGACQPLKALDGKKVDAVVLGGIGRGALLKLNAMGIRVFRASTALVEDNLKLYRDGRLVEISAEGTCAGHGTCGHED